jgi:hypothetical protein
MAKTKIQKKVELGDVARDIITGFTGTVVARTRWIMQCDRLVVQPDKVKDGKPIQACTFDILSLEYVGPGKTTVVPVNRPDDEAGLGDLVQDRLTGLKGIVINQTTWHNGCSRVLIQPEELKDGVPVEASTCDEVDLKILKRQKVKPLEDETGGPRPDAVLDRS